MSDIIIKDISKSFDSKNVLNKFSLKIEECSKIAIMGSSGVGKTTLLRILMGLENPDQGEIQGLEGGYSCVFQEDRLCEDFSAITNVKIALDKSIKHDTNIIKEHLKQVGLSGFLDVPVKTLSGGMKRRVAIVRAVIKKTRIIIMDEPFKGLDEDTKDEVINYIKQNSKDKTLIMVTHNENEAKALDATIVTL